jgi:hypothetical protein
MDSPAIRDTTPRKIGWETALIGIIGAAIATLGIVSHLIPTSLPSDTSPSVPPKFGSPRSLPGGVMETPAPSSKQNTSPNRPHAIPSPRALSSDSRVVVIGPNSIRGRFTLRGISRKLDTSGSDELTLRLHIASLALPDLVTPFQSAMLEVRMEGEGPIHPKREFSHPVSAGDIWDQDVVFSLPSDASQTHATLRIHYYPESKEIPLDLPPPTEAR